jgi:membrane-associated protease RseP (regulator of RpoE activity)
VFAVNGWFRAVLAIALYGAVVYYLYRRGAIGPNSPLTLYLGVALMVKTQRGKGLLERIGRFERFWSFIGDFGILLALLAMGVIVGLLSIEAVFITQVPASVAPSPQSALGLPGINPIIPLGYGILALVIGVVLHELFHGIMARSQRIGVKSLGILWLVVPIGAFVEQDDAQMTAASRRRRARVIAGGVFANFVLALLFFAIGAVVLTSSVAPNAQGVAVDGVLAGYPAANASLVPGDIIVAVNNTPTASNTALFNVLDATHPGETVPVQYYDPTSRSTVTTSLTLASAEEYYGTSTDAQRGFMGISVEPFSPSELTTILSAPWNAPGGFAPGFAAWIVLPLYGLEPVQGTTASFYHASGPFAGGNVGDIFVGVNVLYWLAWMNLLLGLSNALPILPFDGGLLFRDVSGAIVAKVRRGWDLQRTESAATRAAMVSSVVLVFLIVWLFVGPRV